MNQPSRILFRLMFTLGSVLPLLGTTVFKSVAAVFWMVGVLLLWSALLLGWRMRRQDAAS